MNNEPDIMKLGTDWEAGRHMFWGAIIVAILILPAIGLWALTHGPSPADRMQECLDMRGTVILNDDNVYDGCELRP